MNLPQNLSGGVAIYLQLCTFSSGFLETLRTILVTFNVIWLLPDKGKIP